MKPYPTMNKQCLYCYAPLKPEDLKSEAGQSGFHEKCSKRFFGKSVPPILDFSQDQLLELAEQVVKSQKTVTGVQPKLSLSISEISDAPDRFTIVGLWSEYILKPQTEHFQNLPENEDLTMHLAESCKIRTVPHSLIRMKSGQLAYITKRIDREKGNKTPMEDMCQLTERLTEHKYKGSYEQIAKAIHSYSSNPGLDVVDFYELVLFSFLTGNNDMHLKNFSLIKSALGYSLSTAYDLVASELVVEGDDEELALNLNGKKKKLKKTDFITAMKRAQIDEKVIDNIFKKYQKLSKKWPSIIDQSFLPTEAKEAYKATIKVKIDKIL